MSDVDRRGFLQAAAAVATSPLAAAGAGAASAPDWRELAAVLGDRLQPVASPLAACAADGGRGAAELFRRLKNPYALGDDPGLTQTLGWIDAWTSQPSTYAVRATSAADVVAAIRFARGAGIRLVTRGGGHSYFGNSNGRDSLLVWTRAINGVALHDAFRTAGVPDDGGRPAVSIGAGALWGDVYRAVSVDGGRYVQGGGCLTVGVAGFVLGGGFGSLSKAYGTGAASLLEAEVVTADGAVRTVNHRQEPDLFFALRGGGGGTFGIVTRLTLATHPLPDSIGGVQFTVTAASDAAWADLVAETVRFYAAQLFSPTWGEQIGFGPGRQLTVGMVFKDLDEAAARATWQPFLAWLAARGADYTLQGSPFIVAVPARRFWDPALLKSVPGLVFNDDRPGAPAGNIFWAQNLGEAGQVISAYQSTWLPASLLEPVNRAALANALVAASAHWKVTLHVNKGLAGGSAEALRDSADTAMNPRVLRAFALAICAATGAPAWPGIPGHEPDAAGGRQKAARVTAAMAPLRALAPDAGCYVSESDFFEPDWPRAYWGDHAARLAAIKRRYDPDDLFQAHHTVVPGR